ncbi:hypothetical protein [Cupriavidus necator]
MDLLIFTLLLFAPIPLFPNAAPIVFTEIVRADTTDFDPDDEKSPWQLMPTSEAATFILLIERDK